MGAPCFMTPLVMVGEGPQSDVATEVPMAGLVKFHEGGKEPI